MCQFCLLTFRCYQLPVQWSCFGVHVIFILHIFQFLHMPKWKIQRSGTSHGFMILSGGTWCSEPNEWIIPIHMWHFPAVGDIIIPCLFCGFHMSMLSWLLCRRPLQVTLGKAVFAAQELNSEHNEYCRYSTAAICKGKHGPQPSRWMSHWYVLDRKGYHVWQERKELRKVHKINCTGDSDRESTWKQTFF